MSRERAIQGRDVGVDVAQEVGERAVGEGGVALHREIRRVDLQDEALVDDVAVLGGERVGDGDHVLVVGRVVLVQHAPTRRSRARRPS